MTLGQAELVDDKMFVKLGRLLHFSGAAAPREIGYGMWR